MTKNTKILTKGDYILRRLTKVSRKKWEFYVISRIVHGLDDEEIEFTTQQLVRLPNNKRALTDMYFPQFGIHLEIDEAHHLNVLEDDDKREYDIVAATNNEINRISVADRNSDGTISERSLGVVSLEVDRFIKSIKKQKDADIRSGKFKKWEFENRYNPDVHIKAGYIHADENVLFSTHRDALRCFGYTGGHFQKAVWNIPDESGDFVWFPRLYKQNDWHNELSGDGKVILERPLTDKSRLVIKKNTDEKYESEVGNRIVFAKAKDVLGYTLYRFVGVFKLNKQKSTLEESKFDLVSKRFELSDVG